MKNYKNNNANIEDIIINSDLIVDEFSRWIYFHDAEIVSIKFERGLKCEYANIVMDIYIKQYFENRDFNCYIVSFEFSNIYESIVEGFNHQNVIYEMDFEKLEDKICCIIDTSYGASGKIICKQVKVLKLDRLTI